jgi:hypothetical protein
MMPFVAICYFVALLFELLRFARWLRRWRLHGSAFGSAAVGFVYHTGFLYQQHVVAVYPIGGAAMFFLASAWGLVLLYFLWTYYYPNIPFGITLLPLALLLLGGGYLSVSTFETTGLSFRSFAKMLHAASAAGAMIAVSAACLCGALHLLEGYLLRNNRTLSPPIKLPSVEWSASASRISLAIALCCLCFHLLGGILLLTDMNTMPMLFDPLIAGTGCLLFILLLSPLHWLFRVNRTTESRFVLILIAASFLIILLVLIIALSSRHAHWYKQQARSLLTPATVQRY